jgi:hypothetical protein
MVDVLLLLEWWNFAKLSETKHPPKGEGKQTRKFEVWAKNPKTEGGIQKGKGTNYVQELSLVTRNILQKGRQKKLEKVISLKKSSHVMLQPHLEVVW